MKYLYITLTLFLVQMAQCQVPILERTLSITLSNQKISDALDAVGQKANFTFSYNASLINSQQRLDLVVINKSVRQILDQLFKGSLLYKTRGNYLILLKAEPQIQTPKYLFVSGYVVDGKTGQKIHRASIYDKYTFASAVSDNFGFFRLKLPTNRPMATLRVSKQNYNSEAILLQVVSSEKTDIVLQPLPETAVVQPTIAQVVSVTQPQIPVLALPLPDSNAKFKPAFQYKFLGWLISAKQFVHDENIKDTLHQKVQLSLLPFLGTNGFISGKVTNDYSLNALVGYSAGVEQLELSGLGSLVHNDVNGLQLTGVVNVVGGNTHAVQGAGILNANFGKMKGLQAAGIANIVGGDVDGMQWAGITNIGLSNIKGLQAGALYNGVLGNMQGVQVSGTLNIVVGKLKGWQIAPFNIARTVQKGRQIGVFNFADSSATTPIGLFSFVRQNGYRNLELSSNELTRFNIAARSGMPHFYTIFKVGFEPNVSNNIVWSYGLGMGTAISLNKKHKSFLALEYISNSINYGKQEDFNQWHHANLLLDLHLGKHLSLAFGPTVNYFMSNPDYEDYAPLANRIPKNSTFFIDASSIGWYGFYAGIRIK
jgi:hypothetical protein